MEVSGQLHSAVHLLLTKVPLVTIRLVGPEAVLEEVARRETYVLQGIEPQFSPIRTLVIKLTDLSVCLFEQI
jgi:hypothetical protein